MLYYRAWRLLPSVGPVTPVTVKTHAAPLIYKQETGQAMSGRGRKAERNEVTCPEDGSNAQSRAHLASQPDPTASFFTGSRG